MDTMNKPEVWQRGPVEHIPELLQPVAHALLQACEEIEEIMHKFPEDKLWQRPAGVASPAFHLQHIAGVLDRLFTYADVKMLTQEQLDYLGNEGKENATVSLLQMMELLRKQISFSINKLTETEPATLTNIRMVGRKQVPSILIGLYVHAAEHTMRHVGQLLVTVRILQEER